MVGSEHLLVRTIWNVPQAWLGHFHWALMGSKDLDLQRWKGLGGQIFVSSLYSQFLSLICLNISRSIARKDHINTWKQPGVFNDFIFPNVCALISYSFSKPQDWISNDRSTSTSNRTCTRYFWLGKCYYNPWNHNVQEIAFSTYRLCSAMDHSDPKRQVGRATLGMVSNCFASQPLFPYNLMWHLALGWQIIMTS